MDNFYVVVHSHWDREWYQPFQQMRARLVAMADKMIPMVEAGTIPSFHFDGQTIVLEDYLEVRPEAARRLTKLIHDGKVQVGPWYVLADSFLVSGESLIRNLEIGMAVARRFGRPLEIGYLPDQFGHIAQMPQILAGFGFRTAVLWRGVGTDVNRNRFVWEALDGTPVMTVYLPFGYSNGANLPLDSADALFARVSEIANREREFAGAAPILVMNGTDHTEPDARLMPRIAELRDRANFEVGPLEQYVKRLVEMPLTGVPAHRGELRSPLRAHLLPSVTSARTWIKQRDFANCAALERYADPLAALAFALGYEGQAALLDLAWRFELQNHPHDSICGCSVDQVHEDMRYRFDQAATIAEDVVQSASSSILDSGASGAPAIAVFNPSFAKHAVVSGQVELPDPNALYIVESMDGARIPAAIDIVRGERGFDIEMPAAEFKAIAGALSQPAVMGRTVNRYALREPGDGRFELDLFLSRAATSDLDLEAFRATIRSAIPDDASVRIRGTNAARAQITFVANDLAPAGFTFYRLARDNDALGALPANGHAIANEFYRIAPRTRGVEIHDLARQATFELYFEDDGDRGDEYNFDPIGAAAPIAMPASIVVRSVDNEPVRRRLSMTIAYEIPQAIAPDRGSRSQETAQLTIGLTVTLYAGVDRIDFEAMVTNRSRDHRVRAALRTPIAAHESVHDTSFGLVRRAVRVAEREGTEHIYPTAPHRTFTCVESDSLSATMMSRGLYEVEVRPDASGSTILLTLLRCVGWLSRSDLAMRRGGAGPELRTPGAQELGEHRFEFSMRTYRGGYLEAEVVQSAAAYAFPPRIFAARGAQKTDTLALGACSNPRIAFSTARIAPRPRAYRFRAFSMSPERERARFSFPSGRRARAVDLAGRAIAGQGLTRRRDGSIELELRPFEIVTFDVETKKNLRRAARKD